MKIVIYQYNEKHSLNYVFFVKNKIYGILWMHNSGQYYFHLLQYYGGFM